MKVEVGRRNAEVSDLKLRTFEFGVRCAKLAEALPSTRSGNTFANQLIRSGTSVGANYRAARRARSTAEFISKLGIAEEECDETLFWIDMVDAMSMVKPSALAPLRQEADELCAIIVTAIKTAKSKRT